MSNIHKEIVSNLEGRVHPINLGATLAGVDFATGIPVLREMIAAGRVREEFLRGVPNCPPMYRLVPTFTLRSVK